MIAKLPCKHCGKGLGDHLRDQKCPGKGLPMYYEPLVPDKSGVQPPPPARPRAKSISEQIADFQATQGKTIRAPGTHEDIRAKPSRRKSTALPAGNRANNLTRAIVELLLLCKILAWRNNTGGIFDPVKKCFRKSKTARNGISDVLAVIPVTGRIAAIEIKIGRDELNPDQELFLQDVKQHGGIAITVHDTVEDFLAKFIAELRDDEKHLAHALSPHKNYLKLNETIKK